MRASDSGAFASSAATSCLISARIAVVEAAPPASVATWLPKKYFSSKVPRGVACTSAVVTREMVDSCRPSVVGDLAQHQRPHRDLAVLEEAALALDDRLRDAQDRVEALLHVLDEPARLLQLRGDAGAAARRGAAMLGVQPVDAQARHRVGIELARPRPAPCARSRPAIT